MAAKKETFETRLEALETLVSRMEAGGMTLGDTLKSYEQGMKLAEGLKKDLAAAEEKLTVLRGGKQEDA